MYNYDAHAFHKPCDFYMDNHMTYFRAKIHGRCFKPSRVYKHHCFILAMMAFISIRNAPIAAVSLIRIARPVLSDRAPDKCCFFFSRFYHKSSTGDSVPIPNPSFSPQRSPVSSSTTFPTFQVEACKHMVVCMLSAMGHAPNLLAAWS